MELLVKSKCFSEKRLFYIQWNLLKLGTVNDVVFYKHVIYLRDRQ